MGGSFCFGSVEGVGGVGCRNGGGCRNKGVSVFEVDGKWKIDVMGVSFPLRIELNAYGVNAKSGAFVQVKFVGELLRELARDVVVEFVVWGV